MSRKHGCEMKHMVKMLSSSTVVDQAARDQSIDYVTQHFDRFLRTREMSVRQNVIQRIAESVCIGKCRQTNTKITFI